MELIQVTGNDEISIVERLAREIFHEHYDEYMSAAHVEFYLDKYQTSEAIEKQIAGNFVYYLIYDRSDLTGYIGLEYFSDRIHISKFYVLSKFRSRGLGKSVIQLVEKLASSLKMTDLYVNERNHRGIQFYERLGYQRAGSYTHSYENGHTEIDLLMEKILSA